MAKKRVAILGGGVAAVTAAMQLTEDPHWRDQFESITIYQIGWRLGGKGATGRAGQANRILEHGLHIWLGYYENAFRLIQNIYAEARRPRGSPIRTWEQAFTGQDYVGVMDHRDGHWDPWLFRIPRNGRKPGHGNVPPLSESMKISITRLAAKWEDFERTMPDYTIKSDLGDKLAKLAPYVDDGEHTEELLKNLRELMERSQKLLHSDTLSVNPRHVLMLIEMGATISYGLLKEGIRTYDDLERKLEAIDFAQWLRHYNADPWLSNLAQNALLRGMYDFAFAYENGEIDRPNFAAAPALRTIFRMCFTYKGSIFYKMNAGMGDTIFAPAYEALCNRGVNIQFFHKVKRIELSADKARVARIHMGRQAMLKPGITRYKPLVPVVFHKGSIPLPCWPDRPRYDQLLQGDELRKANADLESFWSTWPDVEEVTLEADKHFDLAVFGISIGSVRYLCGELVAASGDWANMAANLATVRTQSLQLWLKPDLRHLGWCRPSPILDAWVEPLNTWADMTDIMSFETWGRNKPGSLAYFCGPMVGGIPDPSDTDFPARAKAEAESAAANMLSGPIRTLWPSVNPPSRDVVAGVTRANVNPSDRYVLSLAGSAKHRLPANGSKFQNLVITGDWIQNGYNAGCVEAAVWSGIQAANTILGRPLNHGVITG